MEEIRKSTAYAKELAGELGSTYGLYSSVRGDSPRSDYIDVDASVTIIEAESEEAVCLDYRNSPPTIARSEFLDDGSSVWKQIASNFEEFADAIGISK